MSEQPDVETPLDTKFLSIYLDDHVAGATAGLHRVRRMASAYADTPVGELLRPFPAQFVEERKFLMATTRALGIHVSRYKMVLAKTGERVGRLKPNGRLFRDSPMGALLETELLRGAVTGKLSGWQTLGVLPPGAPVDRERLAQMQAQATTQYDVLTEVLTRLRPAVARRGVSED